MPPPLLLIVLPSCGNVLSSPAPLAWTDVIFFSGMETSRGMIGVVVLLVVAVEVVVEGQTTAAVVPIKEARFPSFPPLVFNDRKDPLGFPSAVVVGLVVVVLVVAIVVIGVNPVGTIR